MRRRWLAFGRDDRPHLLDRTFGRFAVLMAVPQIVVIAAEWIGFRRFFAGALAVPTPDARITADVSRDAWLSALVVVATLIGFGVCSAFGSEHVVAAALGALVLAIVTLRSGRVRPSELTTA